MTLGGDTVAVHTLLANQVRPVKQKEIAHVREIAESLDYFPNSIM
jgi:hypothetical protein